MLYLEPLHIGIGFGQLTLECGLELLSYTDICQRFADPHRQFWEGKRNSSEWVTQTLMGRQSLAAVINKILLVWALYHCSVDSDATIILLEGNITVLYIPGSYKENVLPS